MTSPATQTGLSVHNNALSSALSLSSMSPPSPLTTTLLTIRNICTTLLSEKDLVSSDSLERVKRLEELVKDIRSNLQKKNFLERGKMDEKTAVIESLYRLDNQLGARERAMMREYVGEIENLVDDQYQEKEQVISGYHGKLEDFRNEAARERQRLSRRLSELEEQEKAYLAQTKGDYGDGADNVDPGLTLSGGGDGGGGLAQDSDLSADGQSTAFSDDDLNDSAMGGTIVVMPARRLAFGIMASPLERSPKKLRRYSVASSSSNVSTPGKARTAPTLYGSDYFVFQIDSVSLVFKEEGKDKSWKSTHMTFEYHLQEPSNAPPSFVLFSGIEKVKGKEAKEMAIDLKWNGVGFYLHERLELHNLKGDRLRVEFKVGTLEKVLNKVRAGTGFGICLENLQEGAAAAMGGDWTDEELESHPAHVEALTDAQAATIANQGTMNNAVASTGADASVSPASVSQAYEYPSPTRHGLARLLSFSDSGLDANFTFPTPNTKSNAAKKSSKPRRTHAVFSNKHVTGGSLEGDGVKKAYKARDRSGGRRHAKKGKLYGGEQLGLGGQQGGSQHQYGQGFGSGSH